MNNTTKDQGNPVTLSPEALEARRAYKRAWNKANPDKVRAAQARHWEKVAAQKLNENDGGRDDDDAKNA